MSKSFFEINLLNPKNPLQYEIKKNQNLFSMINSKKININNEIKIKI